MCGDFNHTKSSCERRVLDTPNPLLSGIIHCLEMSLNLNDILNNGSGNRSRNILERLDDNNPFNSTYKWSTLELACLIFITAISMFGNGSIAFVILSHKKLHKQYYVCICNLVVVYFITAGSHLPMSIASAILHDWPFGKLFCMASAWINFSLCLESFVCIVILHVDRIVAVYFPLWYIQLNRKPRNVFRGSATLTTGTWAMSLCVTMALWMMDHEVKTQVIY